MQLSVIILVTIRLTAETAEIAEIRKNYTRIPSAFLCELGGELLSFVFRLDRPLFWPAAGLNIESRRGGKLPPSNPPEVYPMFNLLPGEYASTQFNH